MKISSEAPGDHTSRVEDELRLHALVESLGVESLDHLHKPFTDVTHERNLLRSRDDVDTAAELRHRVTLLGLVRCDPQRPISCDTHYDGHRLQMEPDIDQLWIIGSMGEQGRGDRDQALALHTGKIHHPTIP